MKRIGLILSMLFCITAFANNSYADCPAITPEITYQGMPMKVLYASNATRILLVAQPFEYQGICVAWVVGVFSGQMSIALMRGYTEFNDPQKAQITFPIEVCSTSEAASWLSDITAFEQAYAETGKELSFNSFNRNHFLYHFQRCPVICESGTVLQTDVDSSFKTCGTCPNDQCCLTESTTYTLSDYRNLGSNQYLCPVSGGSTPARSPLRVAAATHNAGENALVSAAYARGAYNANVANINNAIEYMEDSSVATINSAKVSADNVSLSVNGFTPSGTVSVNSSNATVSGTFNVPTTVALMDEWGATTTTNATLGGIQQANITNGGISGLSATFTGTASGNLSGTGSFSNASVHVDGWRPVNPQE